MTSGDDSWATLALRVAADLRSAAAELGDEDTPARRQRFTEILRAAEKKLAPQQHPDFYRALSRWFPTASTNGADGASSSSSSVKNDPAPAPMRTPDQIVDALKALWPTLSSKDKQSLANKLGELVPAARGAAAPAPPPPPPGSLSLAPETVRMLGVPPDTQIDCNRLAPLLGLLIEVVVRLDDVAWEVWAKFDADSKGLKRELVMKRAIAALLTGQTRLTIPQMQLQIANLQRLIVNLLPEMNVVGEHAAKHFRQLSPQTLEREVEAKRSLLSLGSTAAQCWESYKDRWEDVESGTQSAVNKEVARIVSGAVMVQKF